MFIFQFDEEDRLHIDDGVAYSYIMGGSATFIAAHMKWYVGRNYTRYVAMMVSNGVPVARIAMLLAVRAAIGSASRDHPDELPHIVVNTHGGPQLLLNGSEVIRDDDLDELTVWTALRLSEWVDGRAYDEANPGITKVSRRVRTELERGHVREMYQTAARMAYSILAVNGMGLISNTHHCSGAALNAAIATMKLYGMEATSETAGEELPSLAAWLYHDSLHPVNYKALTQLVNADHQPFFGKVASTIVKRFPIFPGGTTHLQRAITVRREIWAYERYSVVRDAWDESEVDDLLIQLYDTVIADPVQFSKTLSPGTATRLESAIGLVTQYTIALFGLYDAWIPPPERAGHKGPTAGPGIKRLIRENNAMYQTAKECGNRILASAPDLNPLDFLDQFEQMDVKPLDELV